MLGSPLSTQTPRSPADDGIPAGCVSARIAGRHTNVKDGNKLSIRGAGSPTGEMGDYGIDAHAMASPMIKCARNNLDPRAHHKMTELGLHTTRGHHRSTKPMLGVSSGLIGQKAGATSCFDERNGVKDNGTRSMPEFKPWHPAEADLPAGCVSGRCAGRTVNVKVGGQDSITVARCVGEMGDHGIDAMAVKSPLHKSARSNLDPRDHHKMTRHNPRASIGGGSRRDASFGASSGMIGMKAGEVNYEPDYTLNSSRSAGALPRNAHEEGIPAGCVSGRVAGRSVGTFGRSAGEMGDYGIDAFAVSSSLHKSARNNLDPRDHHKMTRHNPRASVSGGVQRGLGASAGCIGEKAGASYPDSESPFVHQQTAPSQNFSYMPQPRSARKTSDAGSHISGAANDCCAGMPFSHGRCEQVTDFTRSLAQGHTGVRTIKLN